MRLAAHLKRSRHAVYYFRLTIPEILRPVFGGRREIKRSLATRDPTLARSLAYTLSARYGDILQEIRRMTRRGYDPSKFDPNDASTWPVEQKDIERYKLKTNALTGEASLETNPTITAASFKQWFWRVLLGTCCPRSSPIRAGGNTSGQDGNSAKPRRESKVLTGLGERGTL